MDSFSISSSNPTALSSYRDNAAATSLEDQEATYLSRETRLLFRSVNELEHSTGTSLGDSDQGETSLEEKLFDACADAKILVSQVSMHFEERLREQIFQQVDLLHEVYGWESDDAPIQKPSLMTFLRWYYITQPKIFPSLGMSSNGFLTASWLANENKDRLTLEFLANDKLKWFVTKWYGIDSDHSAGVTNIVRSAVAITAFDSSENFK